MGSREVRRGEPASGRLSSAGGRVMSETMMIALFFVVAIIVFVGLVGLAWGLAKMLGGKASRE
jgi:hypothetical protein